MYCRPTIAGLQISQMCTGNPLLAQETRPVIGWSLIGISSVGVYGDMGCIGEAECTDGTNGKLATEPYPESEDPPVTLAEPW